jgi:hypothetical protein
MFPAAHAEQSALGSDGHETTSHHSGSRGHGLACSCAEWRACLPLHAAYGLQEAALPRAEPACWAEVAAAAAMAHGERAWHRRTDPASAAPNACLSWSFPPATGRESKQYRVLWDDAMHSLTDIIGHPINEPHCKKHRIGMATICDELLDQTRKLIHVLGHRFSHANGEELANE